MKAKHENIHGDRYFYCFVDFLEPQKVRPNVYVLPSSKVAETITAAHKKWLETPGHKGHAHKDGPMRRLLPDYAKMWSSDNPYPSGWMDCYLDAWDLLKLERTDPEKPLPAD
jgi:hypothetical protein